MKHAVVALFKEADSAKEAVNELIGSGAARRSISVITPQGEEVPGQAHMLAAKDIHSPNSSSSATGTGVLVGGLAGLLVGLTVFAIPGPAVIAVAPVAFALGSAGIGAITGGLVGSLTDMMGAQDEWAKCCTQHLKEGATIVAIDTNAHRPEYEAILRGRGAFDIHDTRMLTVNHFMDGTMTPLGRQEGERRVHIVQGHKAGATGLLPEDEAYRPIEPFGEESEAARPAILSASKQPPRSQRAPLATTPESLVNPPDSTYDATVLSSEAVSSESSDTSPMPSQEPLPSRQQPEVSAEDTAGHPSPFDGRELSGNRAPPDSNDEPSIHR